MNDQEWIVTREAAERLGVTSARVRQLIAEKKLTGQKVGGKYRGQWLVKASEVEKRLLKKGVSGPMRIKKRMTRTPITAKPKTTYNEALALMEQNDIQHLPILNNKKELVGIVSRSDMLEAEPSRVSTLSVYEIVSLLEKVTMEQIMSHPVLTVEEDCSVSNAAHYMLENSVGCLPVVNSDQELVGIITDTDIFKAFVEVSGGGEPGTRIEAKMPNKMGQLAGFTQAITNAGSWIVAITISYDDTGDYFYADVKERGGDQEKIREELEKFGTAELVSIAPCTDDMLLRLGKE